MLNDAASNATPTKYAQNKRHGIYEGTPGRTNSTPERCRAPKTARGMAKHKLLKATILSRPRARAISVFAAHSAIRKRRMPALHIETSVRRDHKECGEHGRVHVDVRIPGSIWRQIVQRRVGGDNSRRPL